MSAPHVKIELLPPFNGFSPGSQSATTSRCRHVEGPLLLLAGAGSGKTRVITHRMAHLMEAHRVPGPCILAVTFTNKAAEEMRKRVNNLLGGLSSRESPLVSTFHSFCVRLLRRDGARLADIRPGFTRQFTIYDDDDQVAVIKSIFKAAGLDEKFMQLPGGVLLDQPQKEPQGIARRTFTAHPPIRKRYAAGFGLRKI